MQRAQALDDVCAGHCQRARVLLRRFAHDRGGPGADAGRPLPRDGDLVSLPPGAITDPQTVVGMSAAYRINAGQPVRGSSLRNAQSVMQGANVRINARGNGFVVSSEGRHWTMQRRAPRYRCAPPAARWSAVWCVTRVWWKYNCRVCYKSRDTIGQAALKFLPALSLQRQ